MDFGNFGQRFSKYVHGMFLFPKPTIHKIVAEDTHQKELFVPLVVVVCAAVTTAIGSSMWHIIFGKSFIISVLQTIKLVALTFVLPVWFVITWVLWSFVFHFIGSLVSGRDLTNADVAHRTLKLTGLSMAPMLLNILPFAAVFTGYWVWVLYLWSMEANYHTKWRGAFLVTLPYLFVVVLKMLWNFGLL